MTSKNGCPFCLEDVINVVISTPQSAEGVQVQCDNCGARGPIYENEEAAITGWEMGIIHMGKRLRKN